MTEEALPQWSDEVVAESFRAEVRARFEAHNTAYRVREAAELEEVLREHPDKCGKPGFEVGDSLAWCVYQASEVRIDRNSVTIVLPRGIHIGVDFIYMFDHTTVAGGSPSIGATIVAGEARATIEIMLVATWDDSMDASWRKDGHDRKHVFVELYEDDVHALCALIDARADADAEALKIRSNGDAEALKIRARLKLALEVLP